MCLNYDMSWQLVIQDASRLVDLMVMEPWMREDMKPFWETMKSAPKGNYGPMLVAADRLEENGHFLAEFLRFIYRQF